MLRSSLATISVARLARRRAERPFLSSQFGEFWRGFAATLVDLDAVDVLGGDVDAVVFGVLENDMLASVGFLGLGTEEFRDTVVDVYDVHAGLQLFELGSAPGGASV